MATSDNGPATVIAANTEVVGDIRFAGRLEVQGAIKGNISAGGGQEATVCVLENGVVEGDIEVPVVTVNGTVKGNIRSGKMVELAGKARVDGNVEYSLIEMVKGAQINGSLVYGQQKPGLKVAADATGADKESPHKTA